MEEDEEKEEGEEGDGRGSRLGRCLLLHRKRWKKALGIITISLTGCQWQSVVLIVEI